MEDPKANQTAPYGSRQIQTYDRPVAQHTEQSVRPRDAAISCAHFWAFLLIMAGLAETVVGAMIFSEWEGVGALWVGVASVAAGVAGACVMGSRPGGGAGTGFFVVLTILTFVAALTAIFLGDGITYLVVKETDGNCFDASSCTDDNCAERDCVCWEPDGTSTCEADGGSSLRYCLRFAGDCADIGDTENLLLGSTIALVMIAGISFFSFIVAVATCCCCKRIILADTTNNNSRW